MVYEGQNISISGFYTTQNCFYLMLRTFLPKLKFLLSKGFSNRDLAKLLSNYPTILLRSLDTKESIMAKMDFLMNKIGVDSSHVANQPSYLRQSFEKRIILRSLIAQHLLSKGLIKDFKLSLFDVSEELFLKIYVTRYVAEAPELLKLYKEKLKK